MSLQFIVGNAGSGKSTYLYESVIEEAMQHPKENYLVLVPEQFTMYTQRQLVRMHPNHAIMNIDVLSFERLAYRVFDELGTDSLEVLEETGKHLLLRKVAQEKKGELSVLKNNIKKPGYIAQVKSLISELMQYDISPEDFADMIQHPSMGKAFQQKAADVLVLYQGYKKRLENQYITAEEVLQKLMEVAEQSKILQGATVVLDGFTGFTPIQNQFLQRLLPMAKRVVVTVTCDPSENIFGAPAEEELFAMSKKMTVRLAKMARDMQVEIEPVVTLSVEGQGRFVPGGYLSHLEQNLFRVDKKPYEKQEQVSDGISLMGFATPRQELTYVASQIEKRVREEGLRYQDFAVVCADMNTYAHLVPGIFDKMHIPYFLDEKTGIVFHPFVECIKALFMMVEDNYSYESVLRLLRTGMTDLTTEEIDFLENYILAAGVRGAKKYRENFLIQPKGYSPEDMVRLNEIREKFWIPMGEFSQAFPAKRGSGAELSRGLYQWICHYDIEAKLKKKAEEFQNQRDEVKAKEYQQIYGVVIQLLDKLVAVLGDEEMSLSEYGELLSTGFEAMSVGVIPPASDSVMIGDMERTRLSDIKVLFLVGACDGAIPKAQGNGGILSQLERQQLKEASYELAPTDREKSFMQRFYLYLVMTKPAQFLSVSYARVGNDGKAVRRSYLIATLQKLFPEIAVDEVETLDARDSLYTEEMVGQYLADCLRTYVENGEVSEELKALLATAEELDDDWLQKMMAAAFYYHKEEALSALSVDAIFGNHLRESVSKIEQFARCAYAYFLNYGLGLTERQEHAFQALDKGNFYHGALERYAQSLSQREDCNWYTISEEQMDDLVKEAIVETYQTMTKVEIMDSEREAFQFRRLEKTLRQTVWALTEQVRKGSFIPSAFEVDFREVADLQSMRIQLDEMHDMRLYGKVDRVDLWETPDKIYVKIVDYKSGEKDINLSELYSGIQVQLVMYMGAVVEGLKKQKPDKLVAPGAMFYYHINNPLLDAGQVAEKSKDEVLLKELKMAGLVNSQDDVIRAMDHEIDTTSSVIPVGYKKSGELTAHSRVLTEKEFQLLQDYATELMERSGKMILQGQIDCKPYLLEGKSGCDYCKYHGICGFDAKIAGYVQRRCFSGTQQEIMAKIKEEIEPEWGNKEGE